MLASTPIYCSSKLQTTIAISTAESELIALSEATRFIKSITYLINKMHNRNLIATTKPNPGYFVKYLKIMRLHLKFRKHRKFDLV
jgi:hypothetical protein